MASSGQTQKVGRPQTVSYEDLMKPDEDWRMLADAAERRKIQNRLAQRAYRRNMRDRTKELEKLKKQLEELQQGTPPGAQQAQNTADEQQPHPLPPTMEEDFHMSSLEAPDMSSLPEWTDRHFMAAWPPLDGPHEGEGAMHFAQVFAQGEFGRPSPHSRTSSTTSMPVRDGSFSGTPGRGAPKLQRTGSAASNEPETPGTWTDHMVLSPMITAHSTGMPVGVSDLTACSQPGQVLTLAPSDLALSPNDPSIPFSLDTTAFTPSSQLTEQQAAMWGLAGCSPELVAQFGSYLGTPQGSGTPSPSWPMAGSAVQTPGDERHLQGFCTSPYSSTSSQFSSSSRSRSSSSSRTGSGGTTSSTDSANSAAEQSSLLHLAVAGGHSHILRLLLQRCDIPIDVRDAAGYTPLQRAVFAGRTELVSLLLEYGADGRAASLQGLELPSGVQVGTTLGAVGPVGTVAGEGNASSGGHPSSKPTGKPGISVKGRSETGRE